MNNEYYTINMNQDEKVIEMSIKGTYPNEIADLFHQDYLNEIRPINTNDFILKIDCRHMNWITKDMLPKVQISLILYKKSNFKSIHILIRKNPDLLRQLQPLFLFAGISNFEFIEYE